MLDKPDLLEIIADQARTLVNADILMLVRRLHKGLTANYEELFNNLRLSHIESTILLELAGRHNEVCAVDISSVHDIDPGAISRNISRLCAQGLIRRGELKNSKQDIALTALGLETVERVIQTWREYNAAVAPPCSAYEIESLERLLVKVENALK